MNITDERQRDGVNELRSVFVPLLRYCNPCNKKLMSFTNTCRLKKITQGTK